MLSAVQSYTTFKAEEGSLFLMSLGKTFYNNLFAFCNVDAVEEYKTSEPLLGSEWRL